MSLNAEQMRRTSQELLANRKRCPLDDQTLSQVLGFTSQQLKDTLEINAAIKPDDVWLLRGFLEQAIKDFGGAPLPFTVLTNQYRAQSEIWFGIRRVPATPIQIRST